MYYPYQKGRYEVGPLLFPLTQDFGNGNWDQQLFQIDDNFIKYREQLLKNRQSEPLSKYVCFSPTADARGVGTIAVFMAEQLAREYPSQINLERVKGRLTFSNQFTSEKFEIDGELNSVQVLEGEIPYANAFDAVSAQVPEDLAIWRLNADGSEEIEALHLNSPNHWSAESKIGKSFAEVHRPVAHIEKIVPWAVQILKGIIEKGPYVRFAWGVGTDDRLNHHPKTAPGKSDFEWKGRSFNPAEPSLFVRVERQVLWGFPALNRALFTIRTYFQEVKKLAEEKPHLIESLIASLNSMSPDSLEYKGLVHDLPDILSWLKCLSLNEMFSREGKNFYLDPLTGYQVMTRKYLLGKGECCHSKCRHCPYSKV